MPLYTERSLKNIQQHHLIRFRAFAKEKDNLSLNDGLPKGPKYIELIPSILDNYRLNKYGVVVDIRKANN